jgi:hypothetical protein
MRIAYAYSMFLLATAPAVVRADDIIKTDGSEITGVTIVDWDFKELRYKDGARETSLSNELVQSATITRVETIYRRAHQQQDGGNEAAAYELFLQIAEAQLKDASAGASGKFLAQFGYWEAIKLKLSVDQGIAEAFTVMDELVKACPRTKFLPEIFRSKINYYLSSGPQGVRNAELVVGKYLKDAVEQNMPEFFGKEAELLNIVVQQVAKKLTADQARDAYSKFLNDVDGRYPALGGRSRVEIGWTLIDDKKLDEAKSYFDDVLERQLADPTSMARAYLGRGHTWYFKANKEKDDAREALLDYLRLYTHYQTAHPEIVAEALYHAAKAMEFWNNNAKDVLRIRAKLKADSRYSETSWAKKS